MRGKNWIGVTALATCVIAASCNLQVPDTRVPVTTSSEEARQLYAKGRDALERLRPDAARSYFRRALARDPEFALAHLGSALAADSETGRAGALGVALALTDRVTNGERMMILAERARDDGDETALFEHLRGLADGYPEDAPAQVLLGDYYLDQGNAAHAVRSYKQAVELEPALPSAYRGLGRAYAALGRLAQVEEALLRHGELLPDSPVAHDLLAESLMKAGRFEDSISRYEQALALDPGHAPAHVGIGNDLMFLDRAEAARARCRQLLEAATDDAQRRTALGWLAAMHLHEEAHGEALAALRAALALAENASDAAAAASLLSTMGDVLLDVGSIDEAAAHYSRAADAIAAADLPEEIQATARANKAYQDARVALARKDLPGARKKAAEYRGAIRGLRLPEARHRFSELEARAALVEGDHRAAIEKLGRADARDPRILYLIAETYRAAGQTAEARTSCSKVANFNEPRFELAYVRPKARRLLAEL